jgi:glucose-6-phosphate isomerase
MSQPVDPTTTPAWSRLTALCESLEPDLRGWFAADPSRAKSFTFSAGDLYVDLSKNLINADVLSALVDLADQVGLVARRDVMFKHQRHRGPAVHTALQTPEDPT